MASKRQYKGSNKDMLFLKEILGEDFDIDEISKAKKAAKKDMKQNNNKDAKENRTNN